MRYETKITPKGIAQFPWLSQCDTKFVDVGEYKVNLVVPREEAESFIAEVEAIRDAYGKTQKAKKKANLPFAPELDDQGNETGNMIIKCRVKNITKKDGTLWDRKPVQFDASGNRCNENIGGGSTLKASVVVYPWNVASLGCGVTLQPQAIQIINLQSYDGGSDAFGFASEKGFSADVEALPEAEDADLF